MSANVNTTTNEAPLPSCSYNTTAAKIGQTFAYCLIYVVSLAGNIFIGIIVCRTKTMRKPINFLIVNMAMSDLLYPIFMLPRQLTELYVDSWLISGSLGEALCKLIPFLYHLSFTVSIESLVLIAVDRFGAVVFPLSSPLISSKLCPFFILVTWIVAMAIWCPYFFANKLVENQQGRPACVVQWNEAFEQSSSFEHYALAMLGAFIFTPLLLISILYTIIFVKLKSQTIPGVQSANAGQQRMKRERNVLKMSIAIVLNFAVCWLPISMGVYLTFFIPDIWSCSFQFFWLVALCIARAYYAINPCICFIFSGNYRQTLKNLVKCFWSPNE